LLIVLLIGQVYSNISNENSKRGISLNGITPNGITPNGITTNALTYNGITHNALSFNGLTGNGINANGIFANGITLNALIGNAIVANALNAYMVIHPNTTLGAPSGMGSNGMGISDPDTELYIGIAVVNGTLVFSREQNSTYVAQFFQYLVKCALAPTDSWLLTLNGTDYTFPGSLGLVPQIKERLLTDSEGRLLSACLLAHVNHFGIHVMISVRSGDLIAVTQDEVQEFRVYEGAFFGNLANATMYSCQGEPAEEALTESSSRALRVCTDGSTCGFTSVGYCKDVCNFYLGQLGYKNCTADGINYYPEVVNVYLKNDLVVSSAALFVSPAVSMVITLLLSWISS